MMDMCIIVTGDRFWARHKLAAAILGRLAKRYGPDIVIVHGGAPGVDESFAAAAKGLGIAVEPHTADWYRLGNRAGPIRNQQMIDAGAQNCVALHRFLSNSRGTTAAAKRSRRGYPRTSSTRRRGFPGGCERAIRDWNDGR